MTQQKPLLTLKDIPSCKKCVCTCCKVGALKPEDLRAEAIKHWKFIENLINKSKKHLWEEEHQFYRGAQWVLRKFFNLSEKDIAK